MTQLGPAEGDHSMIIITKWNLPLKNNDNTADKKNSIEGASLLEKFDRDYRHYRNWVDQ